MQDDSRAIQYGAQARDVQPCQVALYGRQNFRLPYLSDLPSPDTQLFPELVHHDPQGFRHGWPAPSDDAFCSLLRRREVS